MSKNQPRGPWASAMIDVGAVNPRIPSQASWRQLASMAGLATKTVIDAANGDATATPDTIRAIARALKVDVETVSSWISDERIVSSRYTPPAEAALLTDRQRKALTELIRSMVTDEQRAGEEHEQRSAPTTPAGSDPAKPNYGLAARRGVSDLPDTSRVGEESQDPGGFESA